MTSKIKLLTGGMLMASFILSPALSFADTKRQDREDRKEFKIELKEKRSENGDKKNCLQVFSHLVGGKDWKNENNISLSNCWLPFGIAKKWKGNTGTSTPDIISPTISNLIVTPRAEKAKITWTTNEKTSSEIFYSTSTPVSLSGPANAKVEWFNRMNKDHSYVIGKLSPNTTYYLVIKSKDKAGNIGISNQVTFTTLPKLADTSAPVISNVVTVKATSTIQVGWKTNEPSKSVVYYGTTSPININATSTARSTDNSLQTNHMLTIPNLSSGTSYYMLIEASDENNNKRLTDQFSITTL